MPTVSIVIPAYNEELRIADCLRSILRSRTPDVTQVIVVDNASTDRTAEIVRTFSDVVLLAEHRKGVTRARQCGIAAATGDIVAFIDADSRIDGRWLDVLQKTFSDDPTLVGLSGPCRFYDAGFVLRTVAALYWTCIALPASWITGSVVAAGNLAVRRDALSRVGGFDTSIDFYGDDTDLARRLKKLGRVRFSLRFVNITSARRLRSQGILKTAVLYMANFLSQTVSGRSVTTTSVDVR